MTCRNSTILGNGFGRFYCSVFHSRFQNQVFFLGSDRVKSGDITKLTHADSTFLPSYLGYFFVALSVDSYHVMCFVYGIVFLFSFSSQSTYFNPVFLVLGYRFYSLETKKGTTVCLVSRQNYKNPGSIGEFSAFRINDHTLMAP